MTFKNEPQGGEHGGRISRRLFGRKAIANVTTGAAAVVAGAVGVKADKAAAACYDGLCRGSYYCSSGTRCYREMGYVDRSFWTGRCSSGYPCGCDYLISGPLPDQYCYVSGGVPSCTCV